MKRDSSKTSTMMASIHGKDTSIELVLRKALYHEGYRYRKNVSTLPGHPDIVLRKYRVCIFCDGDFFHGYDLARIEGQLKTNKAFWSAKIRRNRERDRKVDRQLVEMGYVVLRFWEHEIKEDLKKVLDEIELVTEKMERRKQERLER